MLVISLVGCGEGGVIGIAHSEKSRIVSPDISETDLDTLVDG